jgi:hypothetical protein
LEIGGGCWQALRVAAMEDDSGTGFRQTLLDGFAKAAGASGNEGDAVD